MTPSTCCPQGSWCCQRSEGGLRAAGPVPVVGLGQGTRVGGWSPHPRVDGGGAGLTTHPGPHAPWGWPLRRLCKDGHGGWGGPAGMLGQGCLQGTPGGAAARGGVSGGRSGQAASASWGVQDREGAQLKRDEQWRRLGLPWPQVPPPCLSKEGIEGPPVLTTSLLAPVPRKAGWGASSVSRHSFLGAGCSFPGQHSAVMELGGQVWRRTAGEMGAPDSDLDPGAPLRGFSGTALTARAARLGAELHGHAALPLSPVAAWALGVTARSDLLPRTARSLASTRSRSQLASPLPSPLTASRASSQSSRTRLAKVRSPHVGSGTLSQG